jgi:Fe-S-cluster-containing hydrogenase component 2
MKVVRKIIEIDEELCDGCGQCVLSCAEGSLEIVDGKARVISDNLCDGLGACIGECPQGALRIVEREAEPFDEDAVEAHLKKTAQNAPAAPAGCPSAAIRSFPGADPCAEANRPAVLESRQRSELTHWPIQIKLVPPTAPFLKGAHLLVAADCVPVAFPSLHQAFLKGRAVMIGCPKFDDVQEYIEKFSDIFKTAGIQSVTTVVMEVPCCSGLPMIVKKGMEKSGKQIPMEIVVVSVRGEILRHEIAA